MVPRLLRSHGMGASTGDRGERTVLVREVRPVQSRSGNTRFVLTDDDGHRYSTFREEIGAEAMRYIGRPARISFHRTRRGDFENVYLDAITGPGEANAAVAASPDEAGSSASASPNKASASECNRPCPDIEEVAWKTAIDAAPWLLGAEPRSAVSAEELFEKLKPLEELVAEDLAKNPSAAAGASDDRGRDKEEEEEEEEEEGRESARDEESAPAARARARRGAAPSQR